ncbi:heavy metal translocating P-type ATPase [Modicisalibacter sp. 'Wilcox']|uniref:heavy metal translocating P-type ATPase n=1 Tax=Modicisalibacter sp. 'Wilcox' TaxID=2679914 RepID=UPI001969FA78|nr:heavy metal translocating P-type ATPase [Modicisalibacter sp. 'Wilcox']
MAVTEQTMAGHHEWRVEGMDCPSCAGKIRGALERLKGVSDVQVSVIKERLSLELEGEQTSPEMVETTVERLGYGVHRTAPRTAPRGAEHGAGCCSGHEHTHDHGHDDQLGHDADDCCSGHEHADGHGHGHGHDHAAGDCCGGHEPGADEAPASPAEDQRVWSVGGMDCPSCAATIRGALEKLPGVADIRVSVMNETLSLSLDEARTSAETVTTTVSQLGYEVALRSETSATEAGSGEASRPRWYATGKGRLVLASGGALAAATLLRLFSGETVAYWGFFAACLVGLVPIARRALTAARVGMPFTIEMLMTIAASGALIIGAAEEAALVIFLFSIGEILEGVAADRARAGIRSLADLVPRSARLETEAGETRSVDAAQLKVGQVVVVRPGDRIPADGEILEGDSAIDESPVTGESVPVAKGVEAAVYAGSINRDAVLRVRVTRPPEDNTIARIIRLVEEAQEARAPTERFVDRFSRVYMPIVVGIAVLVAVIPPLAFGGAWGEWTYRALALLLIGCPCALVISVPASIASALSVGTRHGLLLKGGAVIEATARASMVAFDKTGTLTAGQPVVTDVIPADEAGGADAVTALAASVEQGSSHPLAEAILRHAQERELPLTRVSEAKVIAGQGMAARLAGRRVQVVSPRHAAEQVALPEALSARIAECEQAGKTAVVVIDDAVAVGLIALRDEPRPDAVEAVRALDAMGVRSLMLTGDNPRTAAAIAGDMGLEHRAGLLPDDKVTMIRELAARERVMMVGDGINDAPALAASHVGVAMGSGTDVALETADGALLRNRVGDVAAMIGLARETMANIRQNIAIALGLKGIFLVTTVLGITGLWLAILADTGATVLVTLNALRLLRARPGGRAEPSPTSREAPASGSPLGA